MILISCNSVLDAIELLELKDDAPHSKTYKIADSWKNITSSSIIGKLLNKIMRSILMNQVIGLDSDYIKDTDNRCTDHISRIRRNSLISISKLFQIYPELANYRRCHPSPEPISLIFNALLNNLKVVPMPLRTKGHFSAGKTII